MSRLIPVRDEAGSIVGLEDTRFAATLSETMRAVGVEQEQPPVASSSKRGPIGWVEIAGIVGGLVLAVALVALINRAVPAPTPRPIISARPTALARATIAPTIAPTPIQQDAYAAPGGALLGTIPLSATIAYQHSAWGGWGGVEWHGAIVWVQTGQPLASLPDLAPPPPPPPVVYQAPIEADQPPAVEPTAAAVEIPAPPQRQYLELPTEPPAPAPVHHAKPHDEPPPPPAATWGPGGSSGGQWGAP